MSDQTATMKAAVEDTLKGVIDPETGIDVMRMRLIEDLAVTPEGCVRYTFRPSSPFCPMAVYLALEIKKAVASVAGVTEQDIRVDGYVEQDKLTVLINKED